VIKVLLAFFDLRFGNANIGPAGELFFIPAIATIINQFIGVFAINANIMHILADSAKAHILLYIVLLLFLYDNLIYNNIQKIFQFYLQTRDSTCSQSPHIIWGPP
jgi:hypothetical protein